MSARKLPPQAHHHIPSVTPMIYSNMDPHAIPDIAPTITHHSVLTVAEANAQLESLAPPHVFILFFSGFSFYFYRVTLFVYSSNSLIFHRTQQGTNKK
jgi:hypothetical protein